MRTVAGVARIPRWTWITVVNWDYSFLVVSARLHFLTHDPASWRWFKIRCLLRLYRGRDEVELCQEPLHALCLVSAQAAPLGAFVSRERLAVCKSPSRSSLYSARILSSSPAQSFGHSLGLLIVIVETLYRRL